MNHEEATAEWYRGELERLQLEADLKWEEESRLEAEASAQFESNLSAIIASGAGDRATAIRWMHEANDTNYDSEYLCFKLGLPDGYFRKEEV